MRAYTVHHRDRDPAGILADPDGLDFVKEGFSWPAFFIPLLWLIYKRMWLALALFIVVTAAIGVAGVLWPMPGAVDTLIALGVNLIMGLQGNDLRRWSLDRRGRREVGIVLANSLSAAEHRFFSALTDGAEAGMVMDTTTAMRPSPVVPTFAAASFSILPEPGRT